MVGRRESERTRAHSEMSCTTINVEHIVFVVYHLWKHMFFFVEIILLLHWIQLCIVGLHGYCLFTVECVCHDTSWSDLKPVIRGSFIQSNTGAWWDFSEKIATYWLPRSLSCSLCCLYLVICFFHISQKAVALLSPLENRHLLMDILVFGFQQSVRWMSLHMNRLWCEKKKGVSLTSVSFLLFYLSLLTWDLLQERKQKRSRFVAEASKINQRNTPLAKLSPNTFRPEPLPGLPRCLPALAHLLLVIGVQGHLFCDLWWQWSSSLVVPQEAAWSFDETFAFNFSEKVWWPVAGTLPSN